MAVKPKLTQKDWDRKIATDLANLEKYYDEKISKSEVAYEYKISPPNSQIDINFYLDRIIEIYLEAGWHSVEKEISSNRVIFTAVKQ